MKELKELIKKLPPNYHELEAETIREVVGNDVKADKLLALIAGCSTDYVFKDIVAFTYWVHAMNGNPIDIDTITPIDIKEIEKALKILHNLCPERAPVEFSEEVSNYIKHIILEENIHYLPSDLILSIFNDAIYKKGITERQKGELKKRDYDNSPYARKIKVIQSVNSI